MKATKKAESILKLRGNKLLKFVEKNECLVKSLLTQYYYDMILYSVYGSEHKSGTMIFRKNKHTKDPESLAKKYVLKRKREGVDLITIEDLDEKGNVQYIVGSQENLQKMVNGIL